MLFFARAAPGGPDAEPLSTLDHHWQGAEIEREYFVYDPTRTDAELAKDFQNKIEEHCCAHDCSPADLMIAGFSRSARIAAVLSHSEGYAALLGLSYPFHKHGEAEVRHGLHALQGITVPTLLVQGTRDAHGNREQVRGYEPLPAAVQVHWLDDGNHRWQVRQGSTFKSADLMRSAAAATIDFIHRSLPSAGDA